MTRRIYFRPLLTGLLLAVSFCSKAQTSRLPLADDQQLSIGVSAGIGDLWGDVGTTHFWDHYRSPKYWEDLHYMASVHVKYSIKPWIATRLSFGYGSIYATDEFNKFLADRDPNPAKLPYQLYLRNQDVKTDITEGSIVFELNPFRAFSPVRAVARLRVQPTLLIGVGYFHFDPYGTYYAPDGSPRPVRLHELRTEGEGLPGSGNGMYRLSQLNMPVGGGLRFQVSEQVALSLEYQYRLCFTDYLDDVSNKYVDPALFDRNMSPQEAAIAKSMQNKTPLINPEVGHPAGDIRGTPKDGDGYSTFGFTLFYTFLNRDYVHAFQRNGRRSRMGSRLP